MPIKLGITGGIGSGKSLVCRLLESMGIPVYISDVEAKRLTATDPFIRRELVALLGGKVYADGVLNKPLLASCLFGNSKQARRVNGIIHPRVKDDFRRWVQTHAAFPVIAIESAILIESGFAGEVDVIALIYAPVEIRIERAVKRDSTSREWIEKRVRSQMSDEEKREKVDFILVNDGETPLIPQVLELIGSLSEQVDYLSEK